MNLQIIGKKIGMTQIYDEDNNIVPVTVVQAGPCPVTQVKTIETDGYNAVQIAFGPQKESRLSKPELGHFKKASQLANEAAKAAGQELAKEIKIEAHTHLGEIRFGAKPEFKVGDVLTVASFKSGQIVDVVGTTKGRGFQGVVKRHNMDGQPDSHGHMTHRRIGSIGMRQTPGHVFKGKKMPGHMGQVRRTVQNLKVVKIDEAQNLLLIKGSFPGANGDIVIVRTAKKAK
ncbi:MAG: 50S ribosomal protein L3 [Puniceicoccales bacterium]|jgi:large subunit ribosomal protein L3|nr:50S ribosomal protein L3 [Puniceicoccales bacterium]